MIRYSYDSSSICSLPSYEASHEFDKRGHRNHHAPLPAGPPPQAPPDYHTRHLQPPNNPHFNRGPPPGLPPPPHVYPSDGPRHGGPGGPPYPPPPPGPHNVHPVPFPGPHPMPMLYNSNLPPAPHNSYRPPQPPSHHYNRGHHPGPRNDRWEPRGNHNNNNQSRPPLPAHLPPRPLAPLGFSDNDRDRDRHYRGEGGHNYRRPDPPGGGGGHWRRRDA